MSILSIIPTNAKRLFTVASLVFITSCAVVDFDQKNYMVRKNSVLPVSILDEITEGVTSSQWLMNHLGEPDYKKVQGKSVVYQYLIEEHNEKKMRLFVVYRSKKSHQDYYHLNIELTNNIVQSYWKSHKL